MMRLLAFLVSISSAAIAFVPSSPVSPRSTSLYLSTATATDTKTGTVKWYNPTRGFGFIEVDDGGPDMYVHATGLTFQGPLIDGEHVRFETENDSRTNKPKAANVVRTTAEAPAAVAEEPVVESIAEKVLEVVKEELSEDEKTEKAMHAEKFQRSRLATQLELSAKAASAKAAEVATANEASKAAAEAFQRARLAVQLGQNAKDSVARAAKAKAAAIAAEEKAKAEAAAAEEKAKAEAAAAEEARRLEEEKRIVTGAGGKPADSKEKDLELTRQIILDYINLEGEDEGVVDDDEDE